MKKLILFAFVSVAVTTVSCRKDFTCTCTAEISTTRTPASGSINTYASTQKTTNTHTAISKKNRSLFEDCKDRTEVSTYKGGSGNSAYTNVQTSVYTCELK